MLTEPTPATAVTRIAEKGGVWGDVQIDTTVHRAWRCRDNMIHVQLLMRHERRKMEGTANVGSSPTTLQRFAAPCMNQIGLARVASALRFSAHLEPF